MKKQETDHMIQLLEHEIINHACLQLIKLLEGQVEDLSTMSKIELGDDVIMEIKRLHEIIGNAERYLD